MARRSQAWKNLERETAEVLGGVRVLRGDDFSKSDVDVRLDDIPYLKIDCKYRVSHSHHTLMEEIREKYCDIPDIPVLVTKHHNQKGAYVTIPLDYFGRLLRCVRTTLGKQQLVRCSGGEPEGTQEVRGQQEDCRQLGKEQVSTGPDVSYRCPETCRCETGEDPKGKP